MTLSRSVSESQSILRVWPKLTKNSIPICHPSQRLKETLCSQGVVENSNIDVGRFRILGGQGLEYWGWGRGEGEPNSQQAHDVDAT